MNVPQNFSYETFLKLQMEAFHAGKHIEHGPVCPRGRFYVSEGVFDEDVWTFNPHDENGENRVRMSDHPELKKLIDLTNGRPIWDFRDNEPGYGWLAWIISWYGIISGPLPATEEIEKMLDVDDKNHGLAMNARMKLPKPW
jgi:hypothetical protein